MDAVWQARDCSVKDVQLLAVGVPAAEWLLDFSHTLHLITEAMVIVLP